MLQNKVGKIRICKISIFPHGFKGSYVTTALSATASPGVSRLLQIAAATAEMGSLTGTENAGEN